MKLKSGGEIHVRCFGRYNASLWDDVFAELPALTAQDIIIVNLGAWYPRFNYNEPKVGLLRRPSTCVYCAMLHSGTHQLLCNLHKSEGYALQIAIARVYLMQTSVVEPVR